MCEVVSRVPSWRYERMETLLTRARGVNLRGVDAVVAVALVVMRSR
jgi:hypothetical protein